MTRGAARARRAPTALACHVSRVSHELVRGSMAEEAAKGGVHGLSTLEFGGLVGFWVVFLYFVFTSTWDPFGAPPPARLRPRAASHARPRVEQRRRS